MVDCHFMKPSFYGYKFNSLSHSIIIGMQQGQPGLSPGMPWPAATYGEERERERERRIK